MENSKDVVVTGVSTGIAEIGDAFKPGLTRDITVTRAAPAQKLLSSTLSAMPFAHISSPSVFEGEAGRGEGFSRPHLVITTLRARDPPAPTLRSRISG